MPNRLINETSPYLRQHANNPVDWYPWGEEALARARQNDMPIFLSIGYSACHWCHVMERESFENSAIADLMNNNFINIKVDREERPDLDSIFMQAVQAQTGRGGWPMSIFLTSEGKPFFTGTYFPPDDIPGMPGFPRVLSAMIEGYRDRRADITEAGEQLVAHLRSGMVTAQGQEPLTSEILSRAYENLASAFDQENGGLGEAPKFPQPMAHEFLLRYYARNGDTEALAIVDMTLERMACGGIYDQLGGGFHRYSTDNSWLVPHFEKMLYDNALLSRLYLHAYQITGEPEHRRIVEETLDYVLREMTSTTGGFYSTQDADSDGVEGKYFTWTPGEIAAVLGQETAEILYRYYGVTAEGNFEGENILSIQVDPKEVPHDLSARIQRARAKLLAHRQHRVPPSRDEKVLTAWNGLMLRSFAEAAATLQRDDYLKAAVSNASFLLDTLRRPKDGRLLRSYMDGEAKLNGYLEDYAFLTDGLLALHEVTLDMRWLLEARSLADGMMDLFWDEEEQTFFDTGSDHENLIIRPKDIFDNATPSGGSVATSVLLRLGILTGNQNYTLRATAMLRGTRTVIPQAPLGFGNWLCAMDFYLSTPKEIAVIGPRYHQGTQTLLAEVYRRYLPNIVLTGYDPSQHHGFDEIPLLVNKDMIGDQPTAYVCRNYTCLLPATDTETLAKQLTSESDSAEGIPPIKELET